MAFKGAVWVAALVVAAAAYGVYAPEKANSLSPTLEVYAHRYHDMAFGPAPKAEAQTAAAAQPTRGPQAMQVSVATVTEQDFPVVLESLGQVPAYNTVTVKARIDGQITKIGFSEGQMVQAGDLLAEIDARPFQAVLDQAQAKKQQDEANLTNAKLDLARYSTLVKQSFASQQQVDTQNAMVNQLTAQIAADAAAIDSARVKLSYTRIRAPLDRPGRVPARRRRQHGGRQPADRHRRHRRTAADLRHVHRAGGASRRDQ